MSPDEAAVEIDIGLEAKGSEGMLRLRTSGAEDASGKERWGVSWFVASSVEGVLGMVEFGRWLLLLSEEKEANCGAGERGGATETGKDSDGRAPGSWRSALLLVWAKGKACTG